MTAPDSLTPSACGSTGPGGSLRVSRRQFVGGALAAVTAGGLAGALKATAAEAAPPDALPEGTIAGLRVSRMLLGGNLLTHFTHSRDLKYVYALTAHYNTEAKILETLAMAERNGINTLSMHNPPGPMNILKRYRREGGKIQWIICPTAEIDDSMAGYRRQVQELVDCGCEAIYLWGVRADPLAAQGRIDLIAKAVEIAKEAGVPSGVGCHDLRVVMECEKNRVPCDFYIKTFHHHRYPSAPRPEQLTAPHSEHPGYWCKDPQQTAEVMKAVEKPWIAFKIMAAGAIPPPDAFRYAFENGADHILVGMFDFEIAEDAALARGILGNVSRSRPWRS